jgi:hypothetical protein
MDSEKMLQVTSVKVTGDYGVQLRWSNGKSFPVDLREPIFKLKGLKPVREKSAFAQVFIGEGGHSLEWPGELDIGATRLWEMALEQNGHADAAQFIRWRWRHALSLTAAAEALGLSRRQVAYYVSGEHEVPRTVLLACKGWEAEHQIAA